MAVPRLSMDRGSLVVALFLMVALFATGSHGQTATISAPALGTTPRGNVFVTYFGDTQNTTAIGAGRTLPQCSGTFVGQSNLILKLENSNTGLVLQQVGPFTSQNFILWDTAANATLTPSLTGSYVCRLYYNSMVATSAFSYQLNVVVPMNITCKYPPNLRYESLNTLSCTVTGYPLPNLTWSLVNGATISPPQPPLNVSIHNVTSTMSFLGNQTGLAAGSTIIITATAQFPSFACTTLQTLTAINRCTSISTSVTVTSGPLQIVASCQPFDDLSLDSTPTTVMPYNSTMNVSCGANDTIPRDSPRITSLTCQANGTWSTSPNCVADLCPSRCLFPGSSCYLTISGVPMCTCPFGSTGDGRLPEGCTTMPPTTAIPPTTPPTTSPHFTTPTTSPYFTTATTSNFTGPTTSPTSPTSPVSTDPGLDDWVIPVAVVCGIALIGIVIVIVLCLVKHKKNRKPSDTEPLPQASPKSKQVAETEDQYDTFVRNDGRQPQQVTDPSADPDHYDTFHHPDQQEPGTGPSARPDTYDHIVLNKSIPAEGETYDHLDREQVQAIKQGQQPGQQSAAATALSTQQAGNPRVDASYSMVDMSKKNSRPLLV